MLPSAGCLDCAINNSIPGERLVCTDPRCRCTWRCHPGTYRRHSRNHAPSIRFRSWSIPYICRPTFCWWSTSWPSRPCRGTPSPWTWDTPPWGLPSSLHRFIIDSSTSWQTRSNDKADIFFSQQTKLEDTSLCPMYTFHRVEEDLHAFLVQHQRHRVLLLPVHLHRSLQDRDRRGFHRFRSTARRFTTITTPNRSARIPTKVAIIYIIYKSNQMGAFVLLIWWFIWAHAITRINIRVAPGESRYLKLRTRRKMPLCNLSARNGAQSPLVTRPEGRRVRISNIDYREIDYQ